MCPFSSEESARTTVRGLQIIVGALTMGVLWFTAIAVYIVASGRHGQQPPNSKVAYMAAGLAPILLGLRLVIGGMIAGSQRRRFAAEHQRLPNGKIGDRFLTTFHLKTIVERAVVEGALFFVLVSFLIDRQWWSLAVASALLVGLIFPFPTYAGAADWVRHQVELVELSRQS